MLVARRITLLCAAIGLIVLIGCSMDPPADGVQIQLHEKLTDAQIKKLKGKLKRLDGGISTVVHTNSGGMISINLSPVADPEAFAKKIKFATVLSIDGSLITLQVRPGSL